MGSLKHIEINIGKACNNKCKFCMSSKSDLWDIKFVDFEIIKEKIKEYSEKGYRSIGFLGGDISINPNLVEIISYSKENNFIDINVISNGMKFDDFELSQKLVKAGLTRINFSIHSHLDEIEDYLTQIKGGLQRKLKAIDNFNKLYFNGKLRDSISINIVVNKKNYKTIIKTVLFYFLKKKIKDIRINFIWLNKDVKENWDSLKLSYKEFLPYLKKLIYLSIKYNFRLTFDTIPACIFYKIDNNNYKKLVEKFLGEDQDHITEIDHINNNDNFDWKKRKKDMLKMQFKDCSKCIYNNTCEGVRKEYFEIYGGKEFIPISGDLIIKQKKSNISKNIIKKDLKYYYKKIDNGNLKEIRKEIIDLYTKNLDERYSNLYSVFLSKEGEYKEANNILFKLLKSNSKIDEIGNIYFNIAVNYSNIGDNSKVEEFLKKAKKTIGNNDNFKKFYDNFYGKDKKYYLDDFKNEIINYYKINNKEIEKKFNYINNLVDNLK